MDLEYIIQFISICLSYFDVSHCEIWTESEYIYICIYLKTLKKWYIFQFLMGEGHGTFESQKPFPSPTFLRRLNCWMALTMSGAETCKQPHIFCSVRLRQRTMTFPCKPKDFIPYAVLSWFSDFVHCCFATKSLHMFYTQRSRYTAVYSWPFGCSSHWASSIYR